jgi:hypothetical protein
MSEYALAVAGTIFGAIGALADITIVVLMIREKPTTISGQRRYWPWLLALTLTTVASVAPGYFIYRLTNSPTNAELTSSSVPTELRLQFNGGNILPSGIELKNIWRWYALDTIIEFVDPKGNKKTERMWTLFLTYEKPIAVKEVLVDSNGSPLPIYEVKDSNSHSAVVVFSGDLAGIVVDIRVIS